MYKFFFICCLTTTLALPQNYNNNQHNEAAPQPASIPTLTIPKFLQDALKQKEQQLKANTAVSLPGPQQQQYQVAASSINPGQQLLQQQQQQSIQQQSQPQQQQFLLQPQQSQLKQSQQQPLLQQLASAQNFLPFQSARSLQQQQPAIFPQQPHSQSPSLLQQQQQQQQFSQLPSQGQLINHHTQSGPVVTKDIYVHIPPFDNEHQQHHVHQQQHNLLPPRKHYRIVFIKAPTPDTKSNAVQLTQAPIEEKTIIYVLSKKPDSTQLHNSIQESLAKYKPSKPEVYFIKYKTPEEAQHAQRTIQAQYDKLGGTTQISDEGVAPITSVIGSLDVRSGDNNNVQTTASK